MIKKRKKPRFHRQYSQTRIAIKNNPRWRKPRGIYSWQALGKKSAGIRPTIGYRQPKEIRGKHPSGYYEVLVKAIKQIESIDPKTQAIRLSATLGMKKRIEIIKKADEKKIKVLNKTENKLSKKKKMKIKRKEADKKKEEKQKTTKKDAKKETQKTGIAEIAAETTPTKEEKKAAEEVKSEK